MNIMPRKIIGENLKNEIRSFYQIKPITIREVGKEFNLSEPTVIKILGDMPRWPKNKILNPEINEDYFEVIDNERKAYFIGLMISDGNVFVPKNGGSLWASITLANEDKYILEEFRKDMRVNNIVASDGRGCSYMVVRSNKIGNDLSKYGIVPHKTLISYLPKNIDDVYMRHVIRGLMDGDGCISMRQTKRRFEHAVSFSGTHVLMSEISQYIKNVLDLNANLKVYDYKDRHLSEFKIQGIEDIHKFLTWIFYDATIFLKRKRAKYDIFLEHYHLEQGNTEVISRITQGLETP